MLEAVDLTRSLTKTAEQRVRPALEERLRLLQYELRRAQIPTVIVFEGWEAAGKGLVLRRLSERLDPRAFRVHYVGPPNDLELRHHFLWRHMLRLPNDGEMGLYDGSWYRRVLDERVEREAKKKAWRAAYSEIAEFERWLAEDNQVIVKCFFHISRKTQAKRLRKLEKDPAERWRAGKTQWRQNDRYDRWLRAAEEMLVRTDTAGAPWTVVEATDARWARIKVLQVLVERMGAALARQQAAPEAVSRTEAAKGATRILRARQASEDARKAAAAAAEAGMTVEGQPLAAPPKAGAASEPRSERSAASGPPGAGSFDPRPMPTAAPAGRGNGEA